MTHMEVAGGYMKQNGSCQGGPLICIPQLFSNLVIIYLLAYEDGTDRVFRNVSI